MPDYSKGKIYRLVSPHTDEVYVGSTCDELGERLRGHFNDFKRWKNGKHRFVASFKLIELGDVEIQLVKLYPCGSNEELCKEEDKVIEKTENTVNKNRAFRTREERLEVKRQYNRQYYQEKKEEIKEYSRQYQQEHKEQIKQKIGCRFCKTMVTKRQFKRHTRTLKHQRNLSLSNS